MERRSGLGVRAAFLLGRDRSLTVAAQNGPHEGERRAAVRHASDHRLAAGASWGTRAGEGARPTMEVEGGGFWGRGRGGGWLEAGGGAGGG